jgi:hypothetical protein
MRMEVHLFMNSWWQRSERPNDRHDDPTQNEFDERVALKRSHRRRGASHHRVSALAKITR